MSEYASGLTSILATTDNQFGFKPKHGTDMCIFLLKQTVSYYVNKDTPVVSAFIDASKAFDRTNHNLLWEGIKAWNQSQIYNYFRKKEIQWSFNSPAVSHMDGVWERMVRSVRRALLSLTEERTVTEDQLRTFLFEVEAIVNSRPLTPITLEMDRELPLTPNHFLRPNAVAGLPPIITGTKDDHPCQGWRYVQTAADHFWRRFSKEYLRTILPRQKWHDTKNNLEVDDIVLAVDNNCPRSQWALGRIVETYPD